MKWPWTRPTDATPLASARAFAARGASLTGELNYLGLRDGVMLNRDGSLEFALRLFPLSAGQVPYGERGSYRKSLHRAIIGTLMPGARIRFYTCSTKAPESTLDRFLTGSGIHPNPLLQALSQQRDQRLMQMQRDDQLSDVRTFMTVSIPGIARAKNAPYIDDTLRELLTDVLALRQDLSHQITQAGIYNTQMSSTRLFEEAFCYLNPGLASAAPPQFTSVLDDRALSAINDQTLYTNSLREQLACTGLDHSNDGYLLLDNRFVATVSMRMPGDDTTPGITERVLTRLAGQQYVLMSEFLIEDPAEQRAKINAQLDTMQYESEAMGAGRETTLRIQSGVDMLMELESGEVSGRWASSLILIADDLKSLNRMKIDAISVYREMRGITPIVSDAQNLDLFLDCAPFNGARHSYHSKAYGGNAIDFLPLVGSWSGAINPILTMRNPYGGLTGLSPTEDTNNYGVIVVGQAGSGKTHLMQTMLSAAASIQNARTITVDMKDGYLPLYELFGGEDGTGSVILKFGPGATTVTGEPLCVNMFDLPLDHFMPRPDKIATLMNILRRLRIVTNNTRETLARNALEQFYLYYSEPLSIDEQAAYADEYERERQLWPDGHLEPLSALPAQRYTNQGTLSDFHRILRNMNQLKTEGLRAEVRDEQLQMSMELEPYLNANGAFTSDVGRFLDGVTNVNFTADHIYIRAGQLGEDEVLRDIGLLLINDLIWNTARHSDGRWTYVNNEEVGALAMMEGGAAQLRRQFKLGREFGMVPIAVTQEGQDIEALSGLANNASTFIFGKVNDQEIPNIVQTFGLKAGVSELIQGLGGQIGVFREYVIVKIREDGRIDATRGALYTSPLEMMLFSSHKDDKARRESLRKSLGTQSYLKASLAMLEGVRS